MNRPALFSSNARTSLFSPRLGLLLTLLFASLHATCRAQDDQTFSLELRQEAGGLMVLRQDLITLLEGLFDDARVGWDPVNGILRVDQGGRRVDALLRQAVVVIQPSAGTTRQTRAVSRPLLLREGNVLIPVETAEIILQTLGVEFELDGAAAQNATENVTPTPPAPAPPRQTPAVQSMEDLPLEALPSQTPEPTPTTQSTPAPAAADTPPRVQNQPSAAAASPPVVLPVLSEDPSPAGDSAAAAPLQPPSGLEGLVGLTWGQLADTRHRTPPSQVILLADQQLEPLAARAADLAREMSGLNVTVKASDDRTRDQDDLINQIRIDQPDLFLDLLIAPTPAKRDEPNQFFVWVVNDALWPQDRQARDDNASPLLRYRRHQNQSLALGSLLRTSLGQEFPEGEVNYELVPGYVLRRIDAPAAAVLIPVGALNSEAGTEPIARGIAAALAAYVRGMRNVAF